LGTPVTRITVKGNQAWQGWLRAFAKAQRLGPSQLIDAALVAHAKAIGYEPPPARIDAKTRDLDNINNGKDH
jgi:hypothetical protein